MARPATGQVVAPGKGRRSWAIRVPYNGGRVCVSLGRPEDGWNRQRAEAELTDTMALIRKGLWSPPGRKPVEAPREVPTFHEFASEWFEANRAGWADRTVADYEWALSHHLLPYFKDHRLDAITIEEVDRYRTKKVREGKLGASQINKTLKRLSQILEVAEEYDHIARNPARGKRRRVKAPPTQRSWVEPEQVPALLDAASRHMRPVVAVLVGAGLRAGEAAALDWSDVNLATATLRVGKAKTDAGSYREVDLPAGVVEVLSEWKAQRPAVGRAPLLVSSHAGRVRRQSAANIARRLKTTIRHANEQLGELAIEPISDRVTPHSLRRTYASLRFALGDDAIYVARQMGHADAGRLAASIYAKAVKRRAKLSGVYLAEYEKALAWAELPTAEKAHLGTKARSEVGNVRALPSNLA